MNKYIVEFIGTFFLVLVIGLAAVFGRAGELAPVAIGLILIVMVYAGGHISGAHYNPAVSIAVWLRGRFERKDILPYSVAQVLGAAAAAVLPGFLVNDRVPDRLIVQTVPVLTAEFLFTFALVYVILNVATARGTMGNPFYGTAIGLMVMSGAFAVGGISGAVFNPAVGIGLCVMQFLAWSDLWIYLVANVSAAVAASLAFKALNADDQ